MNSIAFLSLVLLASSGNAAPQHKINCDKQCKEALDSLQIGVSVPQLKKDYDDVKFFLFNKDIMGGTDGYSIFDQEKNTSLFAYLSPQKQTKIIIHGWLDDLNSSINTMMKEAYLAKIDYNLIIVDWSGAGAKEPLYPVARSKVSMVAEQVAIFIDQLRTQHDIKPESIHAIGHSLGAHIAGVAGQMTNGTLGRVTGLDPAGPMFSEEKPEERISISSASFVDVIHTCGLFLGTKYQMGHADFFPNKGNWIQPGCGLDLDGVCSHGRSYLYFTESIKNPTSFSATPCASWSEFVTGKCDTNSNIAMGELTPKTANGLYFLKTNSKAPFSEG